MVYHQRMRNLLDYIVSTSLVLITLICSTRGDESIPSLAKKTRPSIVVITQEGRDGQVVGTGTGFIISENGLIATCAHVIGESRPIKVRFDNGKEYRVQEIFASDRNLDLAILKINAKGLIPLEIKTDKVPEQGEEVIAIGNPQGLEFSIVRGIISGIREIDDQSLIQIAIPIEPGNSGGPLMTANGKVCGILNMKSAITENLGFAIPIENLIKIKNNPNPVAMENWLTIGKLNSALWKPTMGADWRQRAGRITVTEKGRGFGGRALCLYEKKIPKVPYEVKVDVKLNDESGAAGLIFESDGGEKHYGFYPSGGKIRLTRFEGADVLSWSILKEIQSKYYELGEWNSIRVKVETEKLTAFLNGERLFEIEDDILRGGKVGLSKFRETEAQFKNFDLGKNLAPKTIPIETIQDINNNINSLIEDLDNTSARDNLQEQIQFSQELINKKIKNLENSIATLRELDSNLHKQDISQKLVNELKKGDDSNLALCALLFAKYDNREIDIQAYQDEIERMAEELRKKIDKESDVESKVSSISKYLFEENGYHGSRTDYYNQSNSYLNEVIDDREGIPITLSIIYIELASRIGIKINGLGLPGHFVVFYMKNGERKIIDPFNSGNLITNTEADNMVKDYDGTKNSKDYLASDNISIIQRMIYNLKSIAIDTKDFNKALSYVDLLIALNPEDPQERLSRSILFIQLEESEKAKQDLEWLMTTKPDGIRVERIKELYNRLK